MAIPRYDYGATLDPWYRRKGITGIAPDVKNTYAQIAAYNEDTLAREQAGARLREEQRRTDLMGDELAFSKRQANIGNLFGGVAFGHSLYGAHTYGKTAPTPGTSLVPGIELAKPTTTLAAPGIASPQVSLGGGIPPTPRSIYQGPTTFPLDESLVGAGAGGAGAGPPGAAAGGPTLTNPNTPGYASVPLTKPVTPGVFDFGAESLAAQAGGGVTGAAVTAGAGIAGDIGGRALGKWIAGKTGMHEKTASDVGGALATFAAVTAATQNPILGLAAGAVDAIFSMF